MSTSGARAAMKSQAVDKPRLRALLVEDNELDAELVLRALRRDGLEVDAAVVQDEKAFVRAVRASCPDVVLADFNLPAWKGMEAVEVLRREGLDVPLILVSGAVGDMTAVECIKQGATDHVLKDGLARLPAAIRRALEERRLRQSRLQAQGELAKKAAELERSNADLEQFAYVASHDLQEPLRMVTAHTQLLGERYRGRLDADADKFIGYASEGALRMQVLIQDLLAFSRVGRKDVPQKNVDCNAVMKEVLQPLEAAIGESGAVITYDSLPVIQGDRTQMSQLFQNLIGNAIKFRHGKAPEIGIRAERRERGQTGGESEDTPKDGPGEEWLFSVSDNGIGIAPEYLENVFVVFQRLHARTEYAGNGIGLAICKKIVERGGGRIWVESKPGEGSTFYFTFPVAEAPAAAQVTSAGYSG